METTIPQLHKILKDLEIRNKVIQQGSAQFLLDYCDKKFVEVKE